MAASFRNQVRSVVRRYALNSPGIYNFQLMSRMWLRYVLRQVHDRDYLWLKTHLRNTPETVIWDIGANWGQSILSIKAILPQVKIISFEPNPVAFDRAAKIGRRFKTVQVENLALGKVDGSLELFIPRARGLEFAELASTRDVEQKEFSEVIRSFGFPVEDGDVHIDRVSVQTGRIDDCSYAPPALIKMDTEGTELDVLIGARNTLLEHHPVLLIEGGWREEILSFLKELGYTAHWYDERVDQLRPYEDHSPSPNLYFCYDALAEAL